MEEDRDISLYGKVAVVEANLRDDTFWKLTKDYFGPQTGEGLELDSSTCKNKVLIQIGLMREDRHLSWTAVIKWLQKIFPEHKSADFQCLIETGIATTLSLEGDARQLFLESAVNFNFVGPICDSIGVERADLLEKRDFAERAQSIEVITNALILELTNFVTREKLDPVILVTWLKNFNPEFCQDGDIPKAYKSLRKKIKQFRRLYRNYETRSHRRNTAMENLLQSPFELVPRKDGGRRFGAKKHISTQRSTSEHENIIMQDDCEYVPSVEEHSVDKSITEKGEHVSENEREENYLTNADMGNQLNVEGPQDDEEEPLTLLEVTMHNVQKLEDVNGGKTHVSKKLSLDLLKYQYALTCKHHPEILELETKITSVSENITLAPPLNLLHSSAHFLVDIHDAIELQLMTIEGEIMQETGNKLGRDANQKFKSFVNFSESVTSRYIHMASDVLSPHAPAEQNYRRHWEAFCKEKGNPSKLALDMSNKFTKYFEAAAGLIHHHQEIPSFFSDLLELEINDCPNIILESVVADASDDVLQSLVCVLGIIYLKILGPFWQLLKSGAEYTRFSQYILGLYQKLIEWCQDPSLLLEPEVMANVFLQFPLQENDFDRVSHYLCQPHTNLERIKGCLQKMLKVIIVATEENFKDFLPGGIYCGSPTPHTCQQLSSCTFAILMAQYPHHEDEDKSKKQRPDHKSSDFSRLSDLEDSSLGSFEDNSPDFHPRRRGKHSFKLDGRQRRALPYHLKRPGLDKNKMDDELGGITYVDDEIQMEEKGGGTTYVHDDQAVHHGDEQPAFLSLPMDRDLVVATVTKNGGPCKTKQDVDKLLLRFDGNTYAEKRNALHCEILYQKMVLDNNNPNLNLICHSNSEMAIRLKLALPRVKPGYNLVLAPRLTYKKYPKKPTQE